MARRGKPVIAILTDFGYRDHYAGAMKGVIASIAPSAQVIDITHGVPPQSIVAGALALRESWRHFPRDTIFLAVVDPGVGTARKPIAIETRAGARFVGPDNGVLALAADEARIARVVSLQSARYRAARVSSTFHGRDIFAPAAAWLARGVGLGSFGPGLARIHQLRLPCPEVSQARIRGEVIYVDGFGNLVTNISRTSIELLQTSFPSDGLLVRLKNGAAMRIVGTYADADGPLATFGSFELVEIAVRNGDASRYFDAAAGASVTVTPGTARRAKRS